jgi:2-polyprenyl-3-methyl-5-hydroxy-6-metoxy-1,4-benzoquinol methylase
MTTIPTITATERRTYDTIWALNAYRLHSPGEAFLPMFLDMVPERGGHLLDAGCGTGKAALALRAAGFEVTLCDLTPDGLTPEAETCRFFEACLWHPIAPQAGSLFRGKYDWVYCCDVLEHIPTPYTMLVIERLLEVTRKGVFLTICHVPDNFGAWAGAPLHKTVEPFVWWRDNLAEMGTVVEARDLLTTGAFLVTP